jgi:integrase
VNKLKTKLPGRIYKKRNKRPDGTTLDHTTWTVRYKGKDYATGETDAKKAEQFLLKLIGSIAIGEPNAWARDRQPVEPAPVVTRVLMSEVFENFLADSSRKQQSSYYDKKMWVRKHLGPFFGKIPVAALTSKMFNDYTDKRLEAGAQPGSVNRELASLKTALNLGTRTEPPLVERFPKITMLKEATPRQGFLSYPEYVRLKDCLPDYLVPVFIVGYHTGNRLGELLQIELRDVEMDAAQPQYRLYPDATKNGEGRVIPIYGDIVGVFRQQLDMPRPPGCTWLFHKNGERIQSFRKAWCTATELAGLKGYHFHDLRRTAVRNLSRSGIARKIAMQITGHKTEAVYERYNITDEADLRDAAAKMDAYLETLKAAVPASPLIS